MNQISKDLVFSELVQSINKWLTECLFLCGKNLRGHYKIEGMKDQIWALVEGYSESIKNKYGKDRALESEKTAHQITCILNEAVENLIRKNTSDNFFVIDFSVHKTEIIEKLSFIRTI